MGANIKKQEKTKKSIQDGFMRLYKKKSFYNITIKELCEQIGIYRSTFYTYYDNVDMLLREIEDRYLHEIREVSKHLYEVYFWNNEYWNDEYKYKMITPVMECFYNNRDDILILMSPNSSPYFINKTKDMIRDEYRVSLKKIDASFGENTEYIIDYLVSGIITTIYRWLKNDELSVTEISKILFSMTPQPLAKRS